MDVGFSGSRMRNARSTCYYFVRRCWSSPSLAVVGYETLRPNFLVLNAACTGFMSCWCFHGMCSSWISCYRIPIGHPITISPPRVHVEINESGSQVQGPKVALIGKVCGPLHASFPT